MHLLIVIVGFAVCASDDSLQELLNELSRTPMGDVEAASQAATSNSNDKFTELYEISLDNDNVLSQTSKDKATKLSQTPLDDLKVLSQAPLDNLKVLSQAPLDDLKVLSQAPIDDLNALSQAPIDDLNKLSPAPVNNVVELSPNLNTLGDGFILVGSRNTEGFFSAISHMVAKAVHGVGSAISHVKPHRIIHGVAKPFKKMARPLKKVTSSISKPLKKMAHSSKLRKVGHHTASGIKKVGQGAMESGVVDLVVDEALSPSNLDQQPMIDGDWVAGGDWVGDGDEDSIADDDKAGDEDDGGNEDEVDEVRPVANYTVNKAESHEARVTTNLTEGEADSRRTSSQRK